MRAALALAASVALTSCVAELSGDEAASLDATGAAAPLVGVTGTGDAADTSCQIVLRDAGRVVSGNGFAIVPGTSRWLFDARVDVDSDALAEGAAPYLLTQSGSDPAWRAIAPTASTAVSATMTRFMFMVDVGDLPGPDISATGLSRATVRLIPYLHVSSPDARLFDHNRLADVTASYTLRADNGFAVAVDEKTCAPRRPTWMGNAAAVISRGASSRCEGAVAFGGTLAFGSWARQRAAVTDLCFEVYEPGVTDWDNPDLWRQLDAQVEVRFGDRAPQTAYIPFVGRVGNNARYAIDLRAFDPFQWGRCLNGVPVREATEGQTVLLEAAAAITPSINGAVLRPDGLDAFRVLYTDAKDAPRVTCE